MKITNLAPDSKIWIYQSSRKFSESEVVEITEKGAQFITNWNAHGSMLKAAVEVLYNQFIIFAVDENQAKASGCSIDKSVAFIRDIEGQYNVILLDRMQIAYKNGSGIVTAPFSEFESLLKSGKLTEDTIVFNNLVSTKAEFESSWETPVKESWHRSLL